MRPQNSQYGFPLFIITAVMIFGVCGSVIGADDETIDRQHRQLVANTLRGIQKIKVVVEDLHPDAERFGLNRKQIKNDVELKLRLSGIKISEEPSSEIFYIRVDTFYLPSADAFAAAIECHLSQGVVLTRDPSIPGIGITWKKSNSGAVRSADLVSETRRTVKDLVEIFINDYLSVNPR